MATISMNLHGVTSIRLSSRFVSNNGARTVTVTQDDGQKFELTFFGETEALESLVKADDFRDADE